MQIVHHNPKTVAPTGAAHYSLGVEAIGFQHLLAVSGQTPVDAEGRVAEDFEAQAEQAWRNVLAVLESAGMGPANLLRVNTFLLDRAHVAANRAIRQRLLGGVEPASTLVIVSGLVDPAWLIEIEALAAM